MNKFYPYLICLFLVVMISYYAWTTRESNRMLADRITALETEKNNLLAWNSNIAHFNIASIENLYTHAHDVRVTHITSGERKEKGTTNKAHFPRKTHVQPPPGRYPTSFK